MAKKATKKAVSAALPAVTIVIEWENAIDVEDKWTRAAMAALQREIASVAPRMTSKPRIMYLYDKNAVDAAAIEKTLASTAPQLEHLAQLEIIPTDGLTYYKLKNYGIGQSKTDLSIMLDSDAAPQPGWLENLIKPFVDPKIMAVGGFTVLGYDDLLSKTFALGWIFDLREERTKTVKREKIHANNCAVRTEFFRENPFPDLPAFKKQCGFWLRDLTAKGYDYTRTAEAMTVHAPHPGYRFLAWRAWTMGLDRDYQAFQTATRSRLGRLGFAFKFFGGKVGKS
ncbi:MAG TPA: glycosyltransferase, partial [Sphingomicrobium sp.]|nr:glycosyltransferase [Sphingomicrobium sp.]